MIVAPIVVGEARAEADSGQMVFLGLRALNHADGRTDLSRKAEAQRIRATAETALAARARRPVVGHDDLVGVLGKTYVDRWLRCSKQLRCIDPFLMPLHTAGHRIGVAGDYYLSRGRYHFRLFSFSVAEHTVIKEVMFEIAAQDVTKPEPWEIGISGLVDARSQDPVVAIAPEPAEKPVAKPAFEKPPERPITEQPPVRPIAEQPIVEPVEKPVVETPADRPAEPPAEKPAIDLEGLAEPGSAAWSLKAVEIDQPIKIDGVLSDGAWGRAAPLTESYQTAPTWGMRPPVATVLRVVYDRDALYLGFDMETSSSEEPKATVRTRDDLGMLSTDDAIVVALGVPEGAGTTAIFGVNALGTQLDRNSDQTGELQQYDYEFAAATSRLPGRWVVEMRIPWRELPLAKVVGERDLRMLYGRFHPSRGGVYKWPLLPQGMNDRLPQFQGRLVGVTDVSTSGAITLLPYVSGSAQFDSDEQYFVPRAGGDVRLRLGWLASELTLLPDLTDVRPDDQTINLTRFELFQPELRPFFQTGVDVFSLGTQGFAQMFYSRRIGLAPDGAEIPILGGLKSYGRVGDLGVGVLAVMTAPNAAPDDPFDLDPVVFQGVAAAQWRASRSVQVRGMVTGYAAGESPPPEMPMEEAPAVAEQGISFGGDVQIAKGLWQITAVSSGTYNDTDDDPPVGSSQNLSVKWIGARVRPAASILVINNTYNPLVGFVLRTDIAQTSANVALVSQFDHWVKEVQVIPTATVSYDHRFEQQLGYTAGVDFIANAALWSLSGFAHVTEDTAFQDFEVLGQPIPAGVYSGTDFQISAKRLYNNPIVTLTYQRNNAFFTGDADTVSGSISAAIGSRIALSANASGTRALFPGDTVHVGVVNASVAVTPIDRLHLQGLVGYNSFTETAIGVGSIIWQWTSRSKAGLQIDHQPRTDGTSDTQLFLKVVREISR